jgi:hypothetical protein
MADRVANVRALADLVASVEALVRYRHPQPFQARMQTPEQAPFEQCGECGMIRLGVVSGRWRRSWRIC